MGQKGVVFTTRLSTPECAGVFKETAEAARGGKRKLLEVSARLAGAGDRTGFYTPKLDSVFAAVEEQPDFMVGVNILKFGPGLGPGGGPGQGTHVHMYVNDKETARRVELVAQHGMTDGRLAQKLVRRFLDAFRAKDPALTVSKGNV